MMRHVLSVLCLFLAAFAAPTSWQGRPDGGLLTLDLPKSQGPVELEITW